MKKIPAVLAVLALMPLAAFAQKAVTQGDMVELSAKIEAIDFTARTVTLKDKAGNLQTIYAGPEVKRFDELKVGDTVTFRYYESVAYEIRRPGQAASTPATGETQLTRAAGPKPGGTVSRQMTATVTIKAIDPNVPSVTVLTDDGRTLSLKINDKKNIEGFKAGDKVEITYTQAFMVTVK